MSIDPRETVNTPSTNPNRGMRTQPYMIIIIATVLILMVVAFFVLHHAAGGVNPQHSGSSTSSLEINLVPVRSV